MSASSWGLEVGFIIGGWYVVDVVCVPILGLAVALVFVDGLCLSFLHRWLSVFVVGHGETMVLVQPAQNFCRRLEMSIIFSEALPHAVSRPGIPGKKSRTNSPDEIFEITTDIKMSKLSNCSTVSIGLPSYILIHI
jgi:hypothetical protein